MDTSSIGPRKFSWKDPRVVAGDTSHGKGVFASAKIGQGELIMIFGGYVFTPEEEKLLPPEIRDAALQIDRGFVMGVMDKAEASETDYVNHSCEPTAGIKGQISLVARRDIAANEEITFDYGTIFFRAEGAPVYELTCDCGTKSCRGKITQQDWLDENFQKKNQGFMPYYVVEEIEKRNRD